MTFSVNVNELNTINNRYEGVYRQVKDCSNIISNAEHNMSSIGLGELQAHVEMLAETTNTHLMRINQLDSTLRCILVKYNDTDARVLTFGNPLPVRGPSSVDENSAGDDSQTDSMDDFIQNVDYQYNPDSIVNVVLQVPISPEFLNRKYCLAMAERMIAEHGEDGKVDGMSADRIAAEIFAHALGYYWGQGELSLNLPSNFFITAYLNELAEGCVTSGDVADINKDDEGAWLYQTLWYMNALNPFFN